MSKNNLTLASDIKDLHDRYKVLEEKYSEMGFKFKATVHIRCGSTYEMYFDEELIESRTNFSFEILTKQYTIRMGQHISIKAPTGKDFEPAFTCMIILNDHHCIATGPSTWKQFSTTNKKWYSARSMKGLKNSELAEREGITRYQEIVTLKEPITYGRVKTQAIKISLTGKHVGHLTTRVSLENISLK